MPHSVVLAILGAHNDPTLRDALLSSDYAVEIATNATSALDRLQTASFALVVVDLRIPEFDGLDLLRKLAKIRPEIPVALVPRAASPDDLIEAVTLGVSVLLTEPFTAERLRRDLDLALDRDKKADAILAEYGKHLADGAASLRARRFEAASEHARRALALLPARPEAFNLLGVSMQIVGNLPEANRFYQTALALDPTFVPARRNQENLASPPADRNLTKYWLE